MAIGSMITPVRLQAMAIANADDRAAWLSYQRGQEKLGSQGRIRTSDPTVNSRLLYRLSYRGARAN